MRILLLTGLMLMGSGAAYGQTGAQDAMRRYQEVPRLNLSNQEREERASALAAERAQLQLEQEASQPRRSRYTMAARIAAHRANRASQKLVKRVAPKPSLKLGVIIGGASATGLK